MAVLAWLRLIRVFQKVERVASTNLRCSHVSLAHFDVLAHVAAAEGQTQQTLADSLLVTKGNVCQVLGRMEQFGLIERRQEGRTNRLYLTDKGRELFEEVVPAHEAKVVGCFSALDEEEQRTLLHLLRKVDRSLRFNTETQS
jgi:DNA-binding MarR family transcriptional regulator